MSKKGSPDIVQRGEKTQFKRGGSAAVEAQKKSVRVQRQKRTMRETMKMLAQTPLAPGSVYDLGKLKNLRQITDEDGKLKNLTAGEIVALRIMQGAMEDDPECRRLFLELTGAIGKDADDGQSHEKVTVVIDV